eukprot:304180_1
MTDFNDMDVVGLRVQVTMTAPQGGDANPNANVVPTTVEGTVYTMNPQSDMLVLMTQPGSERSSFKLIKMSYISDISLVTSQDPKAKAGCPAHDQALPNGVAQYATLPSLQTEAGENLERKIGQRKRLGEENRKYNGVDDDISIRALEVLDILSRVYPDARWDEDKNCITIGKDIQVKGTPSWNKPKVKAGDAETEARIKKCLEKK